MFCALFFFHQSLRGVVHNDKSGSNKYGSVMTGKPEEEDRLLRNANDNITTELLPNKPSSADRVYYSCVPLFEL